jgi:hypothetical protein
MNLTSSWVTQSFCARFYECLTISTTLINLILLVIHKSPNQINEVLPVASLSNNIDFKVSHIIGATSSVLVLFQYISISIWLGKFSVSRIRVPGTEYNVLILLFLLISNLCSLYIVIPFKYYDFQHYLNSISSVWMLCFTFSYLNRYVGGIMTTPIVLFATSLHAISQILRLSEIYFDGSTITTVHSISLGFNSTSTLTYLVLLFQWLHSIHHIKFENYTLRV